MAKGRRQARKIIQSHFEQHFDLAQLDYDRLCRPARGKSRLLGVGAASALYLLGFGGGYLGYSSGTVNPEAFGKLVWIFMIPASVVGGVVWMISGVRFEYGVRQAIRQYIGRLEEGEGMLWRYGPLLQHGAVKGVETEAALAQSRAGQGGEIDPQDYCSLVAAISAALTDSRNLLPADTVEAVAANLGAGADGDD